MYFIYFEYLHVGPSHRHAMFPICERYVVCVRDTYPIRLPLLGQVQSGIKRPLMCGQIFNFPLLRLG